MVNNSANQSCDNNGKQGTEHQKLADELSFLAGLISKHKGKPFIKKNEEHGLPNSANRFSWTKHHPSSSSQFSGPSFQKKGQRLHNPQYLPSKESLTWKKPNEAHINSSKNQGNKYKYIAKDVHRLKARNEINTGASKNFSTPISSSQHAKLDQDIQARRTVMPSQEKNQLLKSEQSSSNISKEAKPSRKSTLVTPQMVHHPPASEMDVPTKTPLVQPLPQDRSSQLWNSTTKRRVVLPSSQKANVTDALKSSIHPRSTVASKKIITEKTRGQLVTSHSQVETSSKSTKNVLPEQMIGISQQQKAPTQHPNAKDLATLSKELNKCLLDIARLKESKAQLKQSASVDNVIRTQALHAGVSEAISDRRMKQDDHYKYRKSQGSLSKSNSASPSKVRLESKNKSNRSAIASIGDCKWIAPKVHHGKFNPSQEQKNINETKTGTSEREVKINECSETGMDGLSTGLQVAKSKSSPQMKVIRTKYKMKKQLASSSTVTSSVLSSHKIDRRKGAVPPLVKSVTKTSPQMLVENRNKYKLVKSYSHPGLFSKDKQSSSSLSPQKAQVAVNSRFKKVSGSPKKPAIVIPHRSQLKLNRKRRRSHQRSASKKLSQAASRKQSRHKIDRRPRGTGIVRSRFRMRKVPNKTPPRKTFSKQSVNSSPFKWQAKKSSPPKPATPDTFMRRRMRYVLTHTPVLLRTRFRLINSQHNSSTSSRSHSKQPLLRKTRTKLVRKSASTPSSPSGKHTKSRVVNAKGVHYHQSRSGKSLRRIPSPVLASSFHRTHSSSRSRQGSLSRVWTASVHRVHQRQSGLKVSSTQWVANRVLKRTIQNKIQRSNKVLKTQPYCKFYNRYGRCHRGDQCPFIHDPDKVAICTQFLRGTCKKTDGSCPFSHKISKDKMPVCVYFLKGVCNRDDCPYSHVKVSKKAEVCQEFLHGYCPLGAKCKKKHTLDCAEFNETGQCKLGNKCPLWHRKRKARNEGQKSVKRRTSESDRVSSKRLKAIKSKHEVVPSGDEKELSDYDDNSDRRSESAPSFIALESDSSFSTPEDAKMKDRPVTETGGRPALKIRPLFAPSMGSSTS